MHRDTAQARKHMVDGQLRPNRVTDPRIIAAMLAIPREDFLPPELAPRAYTDEDVPLPGGRALIEPLVIARLLQSLALRDGDRMLVVGAGTGYGAAIAAAAGARVTALEEADALLALARVALPRHAPADAVRLVAGPLTEGYAAGAPYDAILIEGAVPEVPGPLADQLAEGGRLATVFVSSGRGLSSRAVLGRRVGGTFTLNDTFDCTTPALPAFQRAPGFVF